MHSFASNLVNLFRLHLPAALRSVQIETLRTRLFKLGARVRQTARRWPFQNLFAQVCAAFSSG